MAWNAPLQSTAVTIGTGGGGLTVTEPAGAQIGDLLVAILAFRGNVPFATPSGWTERVQQLGTSASAGPGLQMFTLTRGASAPTLAFSRTGGSSATGWVMAYRASSGSFAFVAAASGANDTSGTTHTVGGLTTETAHDLLIGAASNASTATTFTNWATTDPGAASGATVDTTTAPSDGAWLLRAANTNSTGGSHRVIAVDAKRETAGDTGNIVVTTSANATARIGLVAFKETGGGGGGGATITANEFEQYRVFEGLAGAATVTLTGTHTGATSNIQVRIEDMASNVVVDWTTIATSVLAGAFTGTLSVPRGGWYIAKVRKSVDTTVTDAQASQWGVGIILGSFGQSHLRDSYQDGTATPDPRAVVHNGSNWALMGAAGVGQNKLTADLIDACDCPVALIETGVGGTAISYWWSAGKTANYTAWEAKVTAAGGKLSAFRLWQGDADVGRTKAAYKADIDAVFAQLRTDYGAGLPVIVMELGRKGTGADASYEAIRDAHVDAGNDAGNKSISVMDLDQQGDQQHFTDTGHSAAGARTANVLAYLGGGSTYYRGPLAVSATFSGAVIDVTLSHGGGTDFTPTSGITGWRVLDNGSAATISSAVRLSATMVRLTCAASLAGPVAVQYGYGAYPDISGWLKDNSGLALPLGTTDADITAQGGLSGSAAGQAGASGDLTHGVPLAGNAQGQGSAGASLGSDVSLAGAAGGQAGASGGVTHGVPLSGNAQGQADAGGSFAAAVSLAGNAQGNASATGGLTVPSSDFPGLTAWPGVRNTPLRSKAEPVPIVAPAAEPISLLEARQHLKIDDTNVADDALIAALIVAARQRAEHETGRRLITQVWDLVLDGFPPASQAIELSSSLIQAQSIVQINYLDAGGVVRAVPLDAFALDAFTLPGYVIPRDGHAWPADAAGTVNSVRVRVACGYGALPNDVPMAIRQWILLQLGAMYENREAFVTGKSVAELPAGFVDRLLDPYRVWTL